MAEASVLMRDEIVEASEQREEAAAELQRQVHAFMALEHGQRNEPELYHHVLAVIYRICATIAECEAADLTREEIVRILEPVRGVHARSPFVARLQQWPRGYAGDFETVEYLLAGTNHAEDPMARACEAYALTRSIAQQHRNKVHHQAARLLRTMQAAPGRSRIASIACGSCPDLRSLLPLLPAMAGEVWLNDLDPDALRFSQSELRTIESHCQYRQADALTFARRLPRASFDLVLAGGLYDYLDDRVASLLIQMADRALAPGGTFFFTNIATGNPYRTMIEYLGDWTLIERSEEDVYRLCAAAGIGRGNVSIRRDESGLALLVEVTKLQ